MRLPTVTLLFAIVAGLAVATGCDRFNGASTSDGSAPPIDLQEQTMASPEAERNLFRLRRFALTEQLEPDEDGGEFWRVLDTTVVPVETRRLLARHGLRLAVGGELAIDRLNHVLPQGGNVSLTSMPPVTMRQNYALDLPIGAARQNITVLFPSAGGGLAGKQFDDATTWWRLRLREGRPPRIEMTFGPWIRYGEPRTVYRAGPTGPQERQEYPRHYFDQLELTLEVREDQIVVLGYEPGHPLSIGDHLFRRREGRHQYVTSLVLRPSLVKPGELPEDATVAGERGSVSRSDETP